MNFYLKNAEKETEKIVESIKPKKKGNFVKHTFVALFNPIAKKIYTLFRNTKKFYTYKCNNCRPCEEICHSKAIKISDGKPK